MAKEAKEVKAEKSSKSDKGPFDPRAISVIAKPLADDKLCRKVCLLH